MAIGTLVGTGYKVDQTVSDYAEEVGTAQYQIDLRATDTKM